MAQQVDRKQELAQTEEIVGEQFEKSMQEKLLSRRRLLASLGMTGIALAAGGLVNTGIAEAKPKPPINQSGGACKTYLTIADALADSTLQEGDVIETIWYEQPNDYGGWTYVVKTGGIVKNKFEPVPSDTIPVNVFGIYSNRSDNSAMMNIVIKRYEYKTLKFLNGKYTFTQPILFNAGYEIAKMEGLGQYNTEIEYTGSGFLFNFEAGLNEYNTQNILIAKMTFTGNASNDFANIRGMSGGSMIEKCIFRNFRDVVKISVSWYAKIKDCLFYGNKRYSVYFTKTGAEQVNNFTVDGCYFMGSEHHIYSDGTDYFGEGMNIENCTFEGAASTGVVLTCFTNIKISGCYFEKNALNASPLSIDVPLHVRLNGFWFEASNARISDTFFECERFGRAGTVCAISTNNAGTTDWDQMKTIVENCFFGQMTDSIDYNVHTNGELIYRCNTNYYHMPVHEHNKPFREIVLARQVINLTDFANVEIKHLPYNNKQDASDLKIRFIALQNNAAFAGGSYQWTEWDGTNAATDQLPGQPMVKGQLMTEKPAAALNGFASGMMKGSSINTGMAGACMALVEIVAVTRDLLRR